MLSESAKGWRKELNLISWNGREPKYDIRDWAPEREKMGKGVTLSKEELESLMNSNTSASSGIFNQENRLRKFTTRAILPTSE